MVTAAARLEEQLVTTGDSRAAVEILKQKLTVEHSEIKRIYLSSENRVDDSNRLDSQTSKAT